MSRNFGFSRKMLPAARIALNREREAKGLSYSSVKTIAERYALFVKFAELQGIRKMEAVSADLVKAYVQTMIDRNQSPSTIHNAVSAINTVHTVASRGQWSPVSATHDCHAPSRSYIRTTPPPTDDAIAQARADLSERGKVIVDLCRVFGLREKEASLLHAKAAVREAEKNQCIKVREGTKGGRKREVPVRTDRQLQVLQAAAAVQGKGRSVMPPDKSWKQFRNGELRSIREAFPGNSLHSLRAAYACERYLQITGHQAPCITGSMTASPETDREARAQIALELGHSRLDVTVSYLGGRK